MADRNRGHSKGLAPVWRAGAPERGEEADACVWGLTAPGIAVSGREASRWTILRTP